VYPPAGCGCLQAALAPDDWRMLARPSGMWLVLTVQLKAEQNVTISRKEDGQIVAQVRWGCCSCIVGTNRLWDVALFYVGSIAGASVALCATEGLPASTQACLRPLACRWCRDLRPLRWKFATGPLPNDLPVQQLDTQARPPEPTQCDGVLHWISSSSGALSLC
jgi:hypothetical protein